MAEIKEIVDVLSYIKRKFPKKQREDFNDEYNLIGSKVAREWLLVENYEIYTFRQIMSKVTNLRVRPQAIKRGSKYATTDRGLEILRKTRDFLNIFFGEKLKDIIKYEKAIRKLEKKGLVRDYVYFGIGPDFVVKKNHEIFFVVAEVNQAKPKKYSGESLKIAKELGFRTMALTLDVEIKVGEISLLEF